MKRIGLVILLTLSVATALLLGWANRRNVTQQVTRQGAVFVATPTATRFASPSTLTPSDPGQVKSEIVKSIFSAPIAFFGKVQDLNGLAISGARVQFGAIDKFWESGSKYEAESDAEGLFSITGIKGAGLTVGVSKKGYDGINGLSYQSFGYGMPPDSTRKVPPRKEAPAVFVLRKRNVTEPLIVVRRNVSIPKNGTPVEVSLKTGKPVPIGQGDLKIECWTSDNLKDARGHYEWHARVAVSNGGLARRTETEVEPTAPESGYEPILEIAMPQNAEPWRRDSDGQYWVKRGDGTFARMRFRLTTAGDHFAMIESYLNPSGSRNLEYDEENMIK